MLKKIVRWVNSKSSLLKKSRILWLYGYVGCGKSAIAQAIALKFADNERLAASFFFFRGSGDRSKTTRFAATIASQVAAAIPSTAPLIHDALRAEEGLLQPTVPLTIQFQRLVYGPIVKATKWDLLRKPFLIVLDGLDECHDKEEISAFIEHSVGFFEKNPHIPLRLFISSRVEEHIRTRLYGSSQVRMMNLVSHTTRQDILTAFRASFDQAARYSRVIQAYGEWPSPEDLTRLVDHVDGSFIFMATIVKFIIGNPDDNPPPLMRLNLALNMNPGLDGLYTETLMRCQHLDSWDKIIWTLSLMKEPMSILQLAHILALKTFQVIAVLVNLHSIFQVPGDDTTPVSFCHSSLVEFLNTESRSGIFKAPQHHANTLAYRCVEIIGNPNEAGPASDYALSHWEEHWIESCKPSDTEARKRLSDVFLSHMRSFMPSFEDIVGTYVLMDLTILSPRERIACKAIRDLGEHRTDGDGSVLAEFLGRSAPVSHTSLVVKVLRAGWPKLQDPLDTRDMWRDPWLSLPDKRPFLRHTLSLASTRLAALAPLPDIDGALKSSSSIYMTHHGETPLAFAWSFLSWVELYIAVVNYEGRIPWHTLYDIPIISNLAHPDPIVLRLLCHLNKAESTVARDRFVNSVKSAIHLSKDVSVRIQFHVICHRVTTTS